MTTRIAILGAGRIGQVHAGAIALATDADLVAVADPVATAGRALACAHGCETRTIDQIAAADDVDAVLICSPTNTHAELIERFCRAQKAVFCEKPVDLDLTRVKRCLAVVAETDGTLMVGFNRRFDPDFRALKTAIDAGRIGKVEMVIITSRDPGPPPYAYIKHSGGIFRDMTIHDFDMARWLLGEEIETVQAAASVLVDPKIAELGDYDSTSVILRTASGRQAIINNSRRASYGYDQRIEVHGSQGMVSAQNQHKARITVANADGLQQPPLLDFFMTRYVSAFREQMAAFVTSVSEHTPTPTNGDDGLKALALADAALLSVSGARTVRLSEVLG
ncbi:MAG: inositol 2-dehydrogenase [Paracoccaceae bacterium]